MPPYTIYVGNPAKFLKKRFTDEQIKFLLDADLFSDNYMKSLLQILKMIEKESNWLSAT